MCEQDACGVGFIAQFFKSTHLLLTYCKAYNIPSSCPSGGQRLAPMNIVRSLFLSQQYSIRPRKTDVVRCIVLYNILLYIRTCMFLCPSMIPIVFIVLWIQESHICNSVCSVRVKGACNDKLQNWRGPLYSKTGTVCSLSGSGRWDSRNLQFVSSFRKISEMIKICVEKSRVCTVQLENGKEFKNPPSLNNQSVYTVDRAKFASKLIWRLR